MCHCPFGCEQNQSFETTIEAPRSAVVDDWQLDFLGVPAAKLVEARTAVHDHLASFRVGPGSYRFPLAFMIIEATNPETGAGSTRP
jgi:hypothetical protein